MGFWTKPVAKIRRLAISEVSLVDKGANQHAHITLFKRDAGTNTAKDTEMDPAIGIVKLAKKIAAGEMKNYRSKSEWYVALAKLAADQRRDDETTEQAFARFVTQDDGGRAVFAAYKSASGPDWTPATEPAPVVKADSAYAKLVEIAKGLQSVDPSLTEAGAFAKVFIDPKNRELAELCKTERVE
ncbi:hypothetical protein CWO89_01240 [Bradyrhizobium sp. Leo170]|nr:hypothetical protein CWO89_01240 [Bradyrhizobium sp. Leo170]